MKVIIILANILFCFSLFYIIASIQHKPKSKTHAVKPEDQDEEIYHSKKKKGF
jgi:hypothetical protein